MGTQKLGALLDAHTLPGEIVSDIWTEVAKVSIAQSLAKTAPMVIGDNLLPVLSKRPSATIIDEGAQKKSSDLEIDMKRVRTLKAQVGLEFTTEMVLSNPGGVLDQVQQALSDAIAEQLDLAVFHGVKADDHSAITGAESFAKTVTNTVEIDPAAPGDVDKVFWTAYGSLASTGKSPNAIAMAPQMVYSLATATDKQGRTLHPELSMNGQIGSLFGLRTAQSATVSGLAGGAGADSKLRAVIGDFNRLSMGRAHDITLERIEYGNPFGTGDLKGRNMVGFLAETWFAYAIMDKDAFALIKEKA